MNLQTFTCYLVDRDADGKVSGRITSRSASELPPGDVLINVAYSSLNYKDALAATGHPGVARSLPHVPGIDACGTVVESSSPDFQPGQPVLVTGYELGAGRWGGWSELIRVPAEWVVPLPEGLTFRTAMAYGTAGFTAAQCVRELQRNEVEPPSGQVVVTGATGGVGCLAIAILAKLGYSVIASTGKQAVSWLEELGASEVVGRNDVLNDPKKPLASVRYAGGVDTVGGMTLASILRATGVNGCVAACGLVGGTDLPVTVYPFILRGVRLAGVTSSLCPKKARLEIWTKLSTEWSVPNIERIVTEIGLADVGAFVQKILAGQIQGRTIIRISE